ncbi:MAG: hypothetical protein JW860_01400, partial [Sedimentisphaerales bacterium]|nr:hypothetical protein [Sedimentisphaerales bacterium]
MIHLIIFTVIALWFYGSIRETDYRGTKWLLIGWGLYSIPYSIWNILYILFKPLTSIADYDIITLTLSGHAASLIIMIIGLMNAFIIQKQSLAEKPFRAIKTKRSRITWLLIGWASYSLPYSIWTVLYIIIHKAEINITSYDIFTLMIFGPPFSLIGIFLGLTLVLIVQKIFLSSRPSRGDGSRRLSLGTITFRSLLLFLSGYSVLVWLGKILRYITFRSLLLILLGIGFLAAGAWRLEPIHELRKEHQLEIANMLQDKEIAGELRIPPVVLFTFRALAIDYLWIRADNLKNDGQYFDALHLARLICTLQPNLSAVWVFQAWNMAYNISVAMPTPQERWNWIIAAIELLRDEGLVLNPTDPAIYEYLAWIFQHKLGDVMDDQHRYYKLRLAGEMEPVLRSITTGIINDKADFAAMADLTEDWQVLKSDPDIYEMINKIKKADPRI